MRHNHDLRVPIALEYIEDLNLDITESTWKRIIYRSYLHYLPGAEKPELSDNIMEIRVALA